MKDRVLHSYASDSNFFALRTLFFLLLFHKYSFIFYLDHTTKVFCLYYFINYQLHFPTKVCDTRLLMPLFKLITIFCVKNDFSFSPLPFNINLYTFWQKARIVHKITAHFNWDRRGFLSTILKNDMVGWKR